MDEMGQKYQAFDIKSEVGLYFSQQNKIPCDWSLQAIGIMLCGKLRRYKQFKILNSDTKENVFLHFHDTSCNF